MAKGSIYQYFEDKADLYQHLISLSTDQKYQIIEYVNRKTPDSLASWYLQICLAEIKFAEEFNPMYRLLRDEAHLNGPSLIQKDQDFILRNLRRFTAELPIQNNREEIAFFLNGVKVHLVNDLAGRLEEEETLPKLNRIIEFTLKGVTG